MCMISVAMAVYNGEKYLDLQINSVLPQLGPDDELVISYDKSTDGTLDKINAYRAKDERVRVVINEDPGVFGNFQNAIENCKGDIIFICDQDDIWLDNKIKTVVDKMKETGCDMAIHNGVHIDRNDAIISRSFFEMYGIGDHKLKNFWAPRYSGCCMAFTKRLKNIILPIPKSVGAYDHWLGEIGERFGEIVYMPDILIHHRLHDGNVTPKSHRGVSVILKARLNMRKELNKRKKSIKRNSKNNAS